MVTRAHLHFFEIVKYWKNCYDNSIAVLRSYPLVRKLIDRWNTGGPIFFLFFCTLQWPGNWITETQHYIWIDNSNCHQIYFSRFIWNLSRQIFNHKNHLNRPPTRIIRWYCDLGDQDWITHWEHIGLKVVQSILTIFFVSISRVLRKSPQIIFFGHTVCFMMNMQMNSYAQYDTFCWDLRINMKIRDSINCFRLLVYLHSQC